MNGSERRYRGRRPRRRPSVYRPQSFVERGEQAQSEWAIYNKRQEFEHELIHRKISWFLTVQGILFTAYGITLTEASGNAHASTFRWVVAGIGLVLAGVTLVGVGAVINSKWQSFLAYKAFCNERGIDSLEPHGASGVREVQWGVRTRNTRLTLLPDALTPAIFLTGWLVLLFIDR
jgi:hypothetical protein